MKIKYLDLCYLINGNVHQDRKEILQPVFFSADDFYMDEMYAIMRLPVIQLPNNQGRYTRNKTVIQLEILVCSCFHGSVFIYLFKGEKWCSWYVKF